MSDAGKRPPWGHLSRRCVYCGKVGPRTMVAGGWAHKRCIVRPVLRQARKRATPEEGTQA